MARDRYTALLVSDFNLANFAASLANDPESPSIQSLETPYGQVLPILLDGSFECWKSSPDFLVVWTQPQGVIKGFNDLLQGVAVSTEGLLSEVDTFAEALVAASQRLPMVFVPTWTIPSYVSSMGLVAMKNDGVHSVLARMNLRLIDLQSRVPGLHLLNADEWLRTAGRYAFSPKLWYMAKVPFGVEVFREAATEIKSAINGITGNSRKLIVVDLDNTLWGGIVGDLGWEKIALGGHDPIGEAFADFQHGLKLLNRRGVLLGIVSKNESDVALEAIDKHPEMILKREDFVGWRINWKDKAQNLAELVEELNLGLQSVVFLDDNPVERARIRETFPEVLVPELPVDPMLFRSRLMELRCFNFPMLSAEDVTRTKMYREERVRENLRASVGSVDEWLKTLEIRVNVEELNDGNISRCVQLLNKTNQLNLSTRRLTEPELQEWVRNAKHRLWTFRVADKFGDSGLTGIASMEWDAGEGRVVDFVLSCRVIGRKVEETMIHVLLGHAKQLGLRTLRAEYLPTAKNAPCLRFLESKSSARRDGNVFIWDVANEYPLPDCISCELPGDFESA